MLRSQASAQVLLQCDIDMLRRRELDRVTRSTLLRQQVEGKGDLMKRRRSSIQRGSDDRLMTLM